MEKRDKKDKRGTPRCTGLEANKRPTYPSRPSLVLSEKENAIPKRNQT